MRTPSSTVGGLLAALLFLSAARNAFALPEEVPVFAGDHGLYLSIEKISGSIFSADSAATQSRATQMAWGPGPDPNKTYLYIQSNSHGVRRFEYDLSSGALTNATDVFPAIRGNGIAFHTNALGREEMYLTQAYNSANAPSRGLSRLLRYVDADEDGVFGSAGDVSAAIVHGIPRDSFHELNQIVFQGNSLFLGSGTRTANGAVETSTGDTYGESAYGGAILTIENVNSVASAPNAAGFAAYLADPTTTQYRDVIDGTTAGAEAPYTSTAANKLRVHSSGTRNPFGLALDGQGGLWFTVNFHRVSRGVYDRSILDGSAENDQFDGASNDDVHDQMFNATEKADYGYRNSNWQNDATVQSLGFFAGVGDPSSITPSHTFDNLDQDGASGPDFDSANPALDQFHDPANPIGLGPHSALTGLEFAPGSFPGRYHGHAFVARWNGTNGIIDGLDYRDIVIVDPATGGVERVISGLNAPIDILADADDNLLVANYHGSIFRITPVEYTVVPSLEAPALSLLVVLLASPAFWTLRRRLTGSIPGSGCRRSGRRL